MEQEYVNERRLSYDQIPSSGSQYSVEYELPKSGGGEYRSAKGSEMSFPTLNL